MSLPVFQILGKLTYAMYLIHLPLIDIRMYASKYTIVFSPLENVRTNTYETFEVEMIKTNLFLFQWYGFSGTLMTTMVISLFWMLTFEIPFAEIDNMILSKGKIIHVMHDSSSSLPE